MLTVIPSPIGSLEEMSLQGAKAIMSSDIVLCEDTRTFIPFQKKISETYHIEKNKNQKIISYFKDNEFKELSKVITLLEDNKQVCIISEGGTPLLSDPGRLLITTCMKRNIPYTCIPGSSASITAGVLAGCRFENFLFVGFLPKKRSQLEKQLNSYLSLSKTLRNLEVVFFESPFRMQQTLTILNTLLPDLSVSICREMNKKFEEVIRGNPIELLNRTYKGELTCVLIFR